MKASVLQSNLLPALKLAGAAVDKKPATLPILGGVLLTAEDARLRVATTDLEIAYVEYVGGKVDMEGAVVAPYKPLFEAVKGMPKNVRLDLSAELATSIGANGTTWQLTVADADRENVVTLDCWDVSEFPNVTAEFSGQQQFYAMVESRRLRTLIERTSYAVLKNDTRPILRGMNFRYAEDTIHLAATDGYRAAYGKIDALGDNTYEMNIPVAALNLLAKAIDLKGYGDVQITTDGAKVVFEYGNMQVIAQLMTGRYPDYAAYIPHYSGHQFEAVMNTPILKQRLDVAKAKIEKGSPVKISVNGACTLSAAKGTFTADVPASVTGTGETSIEYTFLVDVCKHVEPEGAVKMWGMTSALPVVFEDDVALHVIMPMNLNR